MQNMTVELHDSSSGGGRSKASDSHEYLVNRAGGDSTACGTRQISFRPTSEISFRIYFRDLQGYRC
jgi:hypothetical protein